MRGMGDLFIEIMRRHFGKTSTNDVKLRCTGAQRTGTVGWYQEGPVWTCIHHHHTSSQTPWRRPAVLSSHTFPETVSVPLSSPSATTHSFSVLSILLRSQTDTRHDTVFSKFFVPLSIYSQPSSTSSQELHSIRSR